MRVAGWHEVLETDSRIVRKRRRRDADLRAGGHGRSGPAAVLQPRRHTVCRPRNGRTGWGQRRDPGRSRWRGRSGRCDRQHSRWSGRHRGSRRRIRQPGSRRSQWQRRPRWCLRLHPRRRLRDHPRRLTQSPRVTLLTHFPRMGCQQGDSRRPAAQPARPRSWRYRRTSASVELSDCGAGGSSPVITGRSSTACFLPSWTPHWSNESMPQITPSVNT